MRQKMKFLPLILASCFMLMLFSGCGKTADTGATGGSGDVSGDYNDTTVIAEVDGHEITRGQLFKRIDMLAASTALQYGMDISRTDYPEFYENMKDTAFEDLELGVLLDEEAAKENFTVEDSDVDQYIQQISDYATNTLGESMDEYLVKLHATEEDLRTEYVRNSFINSKRDEMTAAAEVTEQEIEEYYNTNIDQFTTPAGIQISHILVDTEEEANQIIADINNGADFAETAKEKSKDTGSAANGGDLGTVNENTNFVEEFKTAALALQPGEMTQTPVKSQYGYHIIKAGDRVEASTTSLADAHDQIASTLKSNKAQTALEAYAKSLEDNATVNDMREDSDRTNLDSLPKTDDTTATDGTATTDGTASAASANDAAAATTEQK